MPARVRLASQTVLFQPSARLAAAPGPSLLAEALTRGFVRGRVLVPVMGKGSCTFKKSDVTRALRAAHKAGVMVEIKISLDRKEMTLTPVKVIEPNITNETNEWEAEYGAN